MKLATIRNGRPDGQLVVVSADLRRFVSAGRIAPTLQAALDDWERTSPLLQALSADLNSGGVAAQDFDPGLALAPLPRAYQWIDCAAYLGHLERVSSLRGSQEQIQSERPLMYQGGSDRLSAAMDPIVVPEEDMALDFEAEIAAILGPVRMRPGRDEALAAIRLLTFCNDVSLRRLVNDDLQNGFGFFHSKPSTTFAPVVATPDEFGTDWHGSRLSGRVVIEVNSTLFGQPDAGRDMTFDFVDLIVEATRTRALGCGTILGAGTIANRHDEIPPIKRGGIGFACIAEARTVEKARYGKARTPFLKPGDTVRMTLLDGAGHPVLGSIVQTVSGQGT